MHCLRAVNLPELNPVCVSFSIGPLRYAEESGLLKYAYIECDVTERTWSEI